jgi:hypothetical protein
MTTTLFAVNTLTSLLLIASFILVLGNYFNRERFKLLLLLLITLKMLYLN